MPLNGHGTLSSDETSLLRENLMPCRLIGTDLALPFGWPENGKTGVGPVLLLLTEKVGETSRITSSVFRIPLSPRARPKKHKASLRKTRCGLRSRTLALASDRYPSRAQDDK